MRRSLAALLCLGAPLLSASAAERPAEVAPEEAARDVIYVVPIHGEINRAMMAFVRRGIDEAKENNAEFVIFDVDTFGGRVDSALQITTLIGSVDPAASVAYVNTGPASKGVSWSAGAIIAFSCSRIYMAPGTSMGAAAPVYQTPEGMKPASEKVVSAVRAQLEALAEKNGYPKGIARAMVDKDVELFEVEVDGKLLALTDSELIDAEREAEKKNQTVEVIKTISGVGKLLTLTAGEMERYAVSSGTVANLDKLYGALGAKDPRVEKLERSSADEIVGMLTAPSTISLLIIIALITLYMEITSPGFGVPGTIAIICFAVIFTSNFLLGRVGSIELLMFLAGVILLILEVFIIPGFGAAGISGILLIVLSLVLSMQGFGLPKLKWEWDLFLDNLTLVGFSVLLSVIGVAVLAHFVPHAPILRRLTLSSSQQASEGFTVQTQEASSELLGKRGVTVTKLRPSGKVRIGDEVMQAETDGEFVEAGDAVEIVEASGNRIVVKKC